MYNNETEQTKELVTDLSELKQIQEEFINRIKS